MREREGCEAPPEGLGVGRLSLNPGATCRYVHAGKSGRARYLEGGCRRRTLAKLPGQLNSQRCYAHETVPRRGAVGVCRPCVCGASAKQRCTFVERNDWDSSE